MRMGSRFDPSAAVTLEFISGDAVGLVDGNAFEFDGGLRFVVHFAAIENDGSDSIEEAAQA